jgi:hypothetical protein
MAIITKHNEKIVRLRQITFPRDFVNQLNIFWMWVVIIGASVCERESIHLVQLIGNVLWSIGLSLVDWGVCGLDKPAVANAIIDPAEYWG